MASTRRYVWYAESGGPGKTTGAVHTSAALEQLGHDVVLVDLDPQKGGATHHLGADRLREQTILDAMFGTDSVAEVLVTDTDVPLIPSHPGLSDFETRVTEQGLRGLQEYRVVDELLDEIEETVGPDVIIVDTAATLSTLIDNALLAAQNVVVPQELTPKGRVSLDAVEETVDAINNGFDRQIAISNVVASRVANAKIFETIRDEIESDNVPLSPFAIPEHTLLKYCWQEQMDIFSFEDDDTTRDLREYEKHVPQAFLMLARQLSGQLTYDEVVDAWDEEKNQPMEDFGSLNNAES